MKRVAYEPRYLAYLRDELSIKGVRRVVMHEAFTNLRKVLFVQFAPGVPRTEVWRAFAGGSGLQADIGNTSLRSAKISTRRIPTRCSGRSPIGPIRSTTS